MWSHLKPYRFPLTVFFWSRSILLLIAYLYVWYFADQPAKFFPDEVLTNYGTTLSRFLQVFQRWDARHFIDIAHSGFTFGGGTWWDNTVAFSPLYPALLRLFSLGGRIDIRLVGLLLGLLLGAIVSCLLYRYTEEHLGRSIAETTLLLFCFWPASLFLTTYHSEGLFLALVLSTFLLDRHNRPLAAACFAGLATLTRPTGSLLVVSFITAHLWQAYRQRSRSELKTSATYLLALLPYLLLLLAYFFRFGTPFASLIAEKTAWQNHLTWPGLGIVRLITEGFRVSPSPEWLISRQVELVSWCLTALVISFAWKRLTITERLFSASHLILFISATQLTGMPRFVGVIFPFYFLTARLIDKEPLTKQYLLSLSLALQIFFAIVYFSYRPFI